MTKLTRFWKNLKVLAHALATEKSITVSKPKTIKKKKVVNRKPQPSRPEIQWPEGEITFEQLCQANVNFSKDEIRKALGQKMEQSRKVLLT